MYFLDLERRNRTKIGQIKRRENAVCGISTDRERA